MALALVVPVCLWHPTTALRGGAQRTKPRLEYKGLRCAPSPPVLGWPALGNHPGPSTSPRHPSELATWPTRAVSTELRALWGDANRPLGETATLVWMPRLARLARGVHFLYQRPTPGVRRGK